MGRGHGQRNENYTWEHKMSHVELSHLSGERDASIPCACEEGSNPAATSPQIIGESGSFTR